MSAPDLGFQFQAMASACEVRIAGLPEPQARLLADLAMAEVRRIEAKYSRYRPDSVLSRLNAAAGSGQAQPVDEETAHLLDFAGQLFQLSDGLFDVTSGILRRAWDFHPTPGRPKLDGPPWGAGCAQHGPGGQQSRRPPEDDALAALLPCVGWAKVRWSGGQLALPLAGMELDFGGFGKEYAADRAATVLQQHGVRHGLVNLGGDIRLVGPRLDGSAWWLGIQHPRLAGQTVASVPLGQGALATSGDYERYFEHQGVRYCHILDPRSGWPVRHWQSVSVVAPACLAAGAISTVAMLKGAQAPAFLQAQGVGYLLVDARGERHASEVALGT